MLDLRAEFEVYAGEVRAAVDRVLTGGQYILGPAVAEFESDLCEKFGAGHAVAVSSGTDALLCALMALEVGAGDEVIVPSFTFFATASTVVRLGARPVFVDIDPRTFNIDPRAVEAAITPRTRAIIAVHLFGQCADMEAIGSVARARGVKVVEDAAQAIGARYHGKYAGTLSDLACFSFYPTKNLGGIGEGGMIFTGDAALAQLCRQLRNHGEVKRYHHERVGGNFRLDSLKCAVLSAKLRYLDGFNRRRRQIAGQYDELLRGAVTTPHVLEGNEHVYHQYSILCDRRGELIEFLRGRGIGTGVYYPVPLHRQECFRFLGCGEQTLPVSEQVCKQIVSLPCHPMLGDDDGQYVADGVREFVAQRSGVRSAAAAGKSRA